MNGHQWYDLIGVGGTNTCVVWEKPLQKHALKDELDVFIYPKGNFSISSSFFLLPANPEFSTARMDFFCNMKEKQQAKGKYL